MANSNNIDYIANFWSLLWVNQYAYALWQVPSTIDRSFPQFDTPFNFLNSLDRQPPTHVNYLTSLSGSSKYAIVAEYDSGAVVHNMEGVTKQW